MTTRIGKRVSQGLSGRAWVGSDRTVIAEQRPPTRAALFFLWVVYFFLPFALFHFPLLLTVILFCERSNWIQGRSPLGMRLCWVELG